MAAPEVSSLIAKGQPRYLTLAQRLIEGVSSGRYPVGSYLPTEAELIRQFNASRFTVRESVKVLQSLGIVNTRRGVGTQVISDQPMAGGIFTFATDSLNDFLNAAKQTRLTEVHIEDTAADERTALKMGCEVGEPLVKANALRVYDGDGEAERVGWLKVYILGAYGGVRDRIGSERRTVSSFIEEMYGIRAVEVKQTIAPIIVSDGLAQRLGAEAGRPGLQVERAYVSEAGEIFEYTVSYHAGKYAEISMQLRRRQ